MEKITFQCPQCGHGMTVSPEKAGKKARCPKCSNILTIPSNTPALPQPAAATAPAPSPPPPPPAPAGTSLDDEDDGKAYGLVDAPPPVTEEDLKKKEKERKKEEERLLEKIEEALDDDKLKKALELVGRLEELGAEASKQAKKPAEDEEEKKRLIVGMKRALQAGDVDTATEFLEQLEELYEDEEEDEDEEDEFDETGKRILKKKPREEAPKLQISREKLASLRKTVQHPEKWNMVRLGTLLVAISVMIWLTAYLLRCLVFIIGASGPSEYAYLASTELVDLDSPSRPGFFLQLHPAPFLIGLVGGSEFFTACLWMMRIAYSLTLVQLLVAGVGYGLCLKAPAESGMRGLLITCCCLALVNFVCVLVWRLLPVTGALDYTLIQYVMPEVAMLDANIDRIDAIHITWSSAIFWESFFAIFMHLFIYLEPVLFCLALRYAGMALKEEPVRRDAEGLIELGLGCGFMVLAFQLLINCGTTEVLVNVLRVVYILFLCFFAGMLIWYVLYLFHARRRIAKALKA